MLEEKNVMDAFRPRDIEEMRAQRREYYNASQALLANADEHSRDLTDDEIDQILLNRSEYDRLGRQIMAREMGSMLDDESERTRLLVKQATEFCDELNELL